MEITAGPHCSGPAIDNVVFFAATFPPLRLVIFVSNELIGRLDRSGAGTEAGWIEIFDRYRDEIQAAIEQAIASGDVEQDGFIRLRAKHFPTGRI